MINYIETIKNYPDFLDEETFHQVEKILIKNNWGFQKSNENSKQRFLQMHLNDDELFTENIFSKIQKITKIKFKLIEVYANGQFFGMHGDAHYDSFEKNRYTFLIYMNRHWDIIWGGQTIFLNTFFDVNLNQPIIQDGIYSQYPVRNLGLMFPSNILHYAESPTKLYSDVRLTVAFKMKKI